MASDVKFCHKKLRIFFLPFETMVIIAQYSFFNTHECQELQIKNPFYPISGFCLVKNL